MSLYNYFKVLPSKEVDSPSRSLSAGNESVKRKRSEEEEGGGKRRSEEPLVRIKKPFVDETVVDEVEVEKKNVVKTISEKTLIEKVLNEEIVVIKNGAKDITADEIVVIENGAKDISAEVTKALNGLEEISVTKLSGDPRVKALRVDIKNVHDKEKEVRNYLMALPLANFEDEEEEEEEEADPYEVEEILEYAFCKEDQVGKYFVKWVGWSSDTNTWEPEANLECTDLLVEFYKTRLKERESMTPAEKRAHELPPDPRETFQVRLDFVKEHCPLPSRREVEIHFRKNQRLPAKLRAKAMSDKELNALIDTVAKSKAPNEKKVEQIREQIKMREMVRLRRDQLNDLRKYEKEINIIDGSSAHVEIINEADLEGPPRQMQYINKYLAAPGIVIPDDPIIGCECNENGLECGLKQDKRKDIDSCCSGAAGFQFAYTKHRKLRIGVGSPIYECNKLCACGPDCGNRVVQNGRKNKLAIYRTDNGCGWGVRASENIKAGSFVVEYVGEMITSDEAEERGKKYDAEGRTYLFDLDFNLGDENLYVVDAAFYGNVSHFINHSCDPNLNIFNVYVDCLDPNMPRLCLFAKREIKKGEQITFDYRQSTGNTDSKNTVKAHADLIESPTKKMAILAEAGLEDSSSSVCRCGAENCRKILF